MKKVLATGTFDILHPGHLHYLRESAKHGDELVVIVARESMVSHKNPPVVPEEQRREMVGALKPVDTAVLGSEESIFEPLKEIQPDVVTLGHDQHYDEDDLRDELHERGFDADVVRVSGREESEDEILSSSRILRTILEDRG
ncbi:MAG: adenylyltransferase/cytidyltransferase family protein [Halobacteriales archaeon]|nr:adenylyltransferase/cytidyltransferase family protein [Halobacteriales archaeon]